MDLERSIRKAYLTATQRNWDTVYVLVDVHDTIAFSNYKDAEVEFYPNAIEALKQLSEMPEVYLVLWTSCYEEEYSRYLERLRDLDVNFQAVNYTPVDNTKTGFFEKKPYFSVLIDDKAGFDPATWNQVVGVFQEIRKEFPLQRLNIA